MSAIILDGKELSSKLQTTLKLEIEALKKETSKTPRFMNIVIGQDSSAASYAKSQSRIAQNLGIDYQFIYFPPNITQQELLHQISLLNQDDQIHGVMLHKPVPAHIHFQEALNAIDADKDLEGMNVINLGNLFLGKTKRYPCTPAGAMALLESCGVNLSGKDVVVVGRSEIVGKPIQLMLLEKNATVTICHSGTSKAGRLVDYISRADVVIVAMGKAGFIKGEWIKDGAIVIDVGINVVDGKVVGDVEFETAKQKASFITPVPGGVGPVTAVMLMKNGIETFKKHLGKT